MDRQTQVALPRVGMPEGQGYLWEAVKEDGVIHPYQPPNTSPEESHEFQASLHECFKSPEGPQILWGPGTAPPLTHPNMRVGCTPRPVSSTFLCSTPKLRQCRAAEPLERAWFPGDPHSCAPSAQHAAQLWVRLLLLEPSMEAQRSHCTPLGHSPTALRVWDCSCIHTHPNPQGQPHNMKR